MLQSMRNGMNSWLTRIIISALFIFAIGGLVLSDSGGFFRGGISKGSVAEIGGQELSFVEFDRAFRNALARLEVPQLAEIPQYREIIARSTLKKEIQTKVLGFTARENGLIVSDRIAADKLREYLTPLTEQGMLETLALQRVLGQQRISENVLVNNIKNDFAIELMMTALTAPVRASNQLISDMEQYNNETRSANYMQILHKDFSVDTPSSDTLKDFHAAKKELWNTPEYRKISVLRITPELALKKAMGENAVTDEDVRTEYEDRIDEFSEEDRRVISQATFMKEDDAIALRDYMISNKSVSLEQAVKDNKALNGQFVSAEEHTRQTIFPQELTAPVFDSEKDTGIIKPVKSPLGWHLAYIEKTTRGKIQSFNEVKDTLRKEIIFEKASDPLFEMINEIEDMIAAGDNAQAISNFLGLPIEMLDKLSAAGRDENNKEHKLDNTLKTALRYGFALKQDENLHTDIHELPDGSFVVVSIDDIIIQRKIDFSEVEAEVMSVWTQQAQQRKAQDRVNDIVAAVRTGNSSLKDHTLGKKNKLSFMTLQKRDAIFDDGKYSQLPNSFIPTMFDLQKIKDITFIPTNDGFIVMQLDEIKLGEKPDTETDDDTVKPTIAALERGLREDIIEQFLRARTAKYGVEINEYSFSKQYGAKADTEE